MAVFTVEIEGFGDLPVSPDFAPEITYNVRGSGEVQSHIETWRFSGVLLEPDTDMQAKRNQLRTIFEQGQVAVTFKRDGIPFETLDPIDHDASPRFPDFNVEVGAGNWVSVLRYNFTVEAEKPLKIAGIVDLTRAFDFDIRENETRKTTRVTARGKNALAIVESFEPPGSVSTRIVDDPDNNTASASYVEVISDAEGTTGLEWAETIRVRGGLHPHTYRRASRSLKPIRLFGSPGQTTVIISGTLRSASQSKIAFKIPLPEGISPLDVTEDDDGAVRPVTFTKEGLPKRFERTYNITAQLQERPERGAFDNRITQELKQEIAENPDLADEQEEEA